MTEPKAPLVTPARAIAAVCVVVPFIAVLAVPIYNRDTPEVAGFPFFFWWQLLWVGITAALMGLAYFVIRREESARRPAVAAAGIDPAVSARVEDVVIEGAPVEGAAGAESTESTESDQDTEGGK